MHHLFFTVKPGNRKFDGTSVQQPNYDFSSAWLYDTDDLKYNISTQKLGV